MAKKDAPAMAVTLQGKEYILELADFTGEDELALFRTVGLTLIQAFENPSLFAVAGLVWLRRRKTEPRLKFEEVNGAMTFSALETVREIDDEDELKAGDGSPEASGAD